jgi:thymidylate synthase
MVSSFICARDISDAWYKSVRYILENGYTYTIDRGSFEGHERKQLASFALEILHPESRPLSIEHNGLVISTSEAIIKYFGYLTNPEMHENEAYTYGNRISKWLSTIAEMLIDTPGTNQATIEVGRPSDVTLNDPPCLRTISWKVIENKKLQISVFFRSWDCVNGLPFNLGGLQLLNELVAGSAGLKPGPMVAYSDGIHVYDMSYGVLGEK